MRPAPALLLVLTATLLSGCDRSADSRRLLAGGWAPPGAACDSHAGVFYDKGGSWAGENVSGAWTLHGDRLKTSVTERGGFDRPARVVTGERASTATILTLTQTDLALRLEDGSTQTLKRCRP